MIQIDVSEKAGCFCCSSRDEVMDVVFETEGKDPIERRLPLCIGCRSELHDELTPDDAGEERLIAKELNW
jgi:hypothetical protein